MAERRLFILEFSRWPPFKWEPIRTFGMKWRAGRLGLYAAKFVDKTTGIVLEQFRPRKERREFRIILAKQGGKESEA